MARQALTVIGAVVGGYFGGPQGAQIGMAIGGAVGGLVDPEIIKVPSVRDAASQTANEGAPIALYDGTCGGAGTMVYCSEPRFVTVRTRQGKGGQVVESERGLLTFAILVGSALQDGPGQRNGIASLIKVWEDDKLVYDISPTSVILEESAAYALGFTYYPGDATQLPDPDLEALLGATNCVAYRGRALFVRKNYDATDRRLTPPVYKFETSTAGTDVPGPALATNAKHYDAPQSALAVASNSMDWDSGTNRVRGSRSGLYAAGTNTDSAGTDRLQLKKWNQVAEEWDDLAAPDDMPILGPVDMDWGIDSDGNEYLAAAVAASSPDNLIVWKLVDDVLVKLPDPVDLMPNIGTGVAWDSEAQRLAVGNGSSGNGVYVWDVVADALVNRRTASTVATIGVCRKLAWMRGVGARYLACGNESTVAVIETTDSPMTVAAAIAQPAHIGVHWDPTEAYLLAVSASPTTGVAVLEFQGSVIGTETLEFVANADEQPPTPNDSTVTLDGRYLAVSSASLQYPYVYDLDGTPVDPLKLTNPAATGTALSTVSWLGDASVQIAAGATDFVSVTQAAGRRCGVPDTSWDLTEMADLPIRGVVVASQAYTGQDLVNGLRVVHPSDGACFDGQIHILKRGGAVDFELEEDFRVEEGSDLEQEETLRNGDDERKSPLRRPAKINLMFPNANLGYTFTKANAPNYGAPEGVVTEVTLEVPCVLDEETEAPQLADILDKISRAEADGELVRIFPDYLAAKAVTGTRIRLVDGTLQRRLRVSGVRTIDGTRRLSLWMDRAHAYVSQATAPAGPGWPTPPPSLPGETVAAFMNVPALLDSQDTLGVVAGISGLPGTAWHGARIEYRVLGMTAWTDLGTYTQRAVMGTLLEALPSASPYWPDWVNPLRVRLLQDDDIDTLSDAEWLSEMGACAIVRADGTAEILQPRDAVNDTPQDWTLSHHQRGRVESGATAHAIGARFVVLDGCIFLPLPSSAIGQTLQFRVTSSGGSPETAPITTLLWDPALVQQEWTVSGLRVERDGGVITASWLPRGRFGTDPNPVVSTNLGGTEGKYQITLTDGATTEVLYRNDPSLSTPDTAFSGPVTVTVKAINRYTGPGPGTSETV